MERKIVVLWLIVRFQSSKKLLTLYHELGFYIYVWLEAATGATAYTLNIMQVNVWILTCQSGPGKKLQN